MPTILIPLDFSAPSLNAATYAAKFAAAIGDSHLILYTTIDEDVVGADGTPLHSSRNERVAAMRMELERLQVALFELAGVPTQIDVETGVFEDNVRQYVDRHSVDLVVMGITGSTAWDQVFGSSNAMSMIRSSLVPVLVVPPEAQFVNLDNVVMAVELHNVAGIIPFPVLHKWLNWMKSKVHVAHVVHGINKTLKPEEEQELGLLKEMLKEHLPQIHVMDENDFTGALNRLVEDKGIDILITFPQKHGFFDSLFTTSRTRQLVFHSTVPVLTLHHLYEV